MAKYVPSLESLVGHYIELSDTVSGDPEVGFENGRQAWLTIARAKAEALREEATVLEGMAYHFGPAAVHLRQRAKELEEGFE